MASWRRVNEKDHGFILACFTGAKYKAMEVGMVGAEAIDPIYAADNVMNSQKLHAVIIGEHTLLVYTIVNNTWCTQTPYLVELLVHKFAGTSATFSAVVHTLEELAILHGVHRVIVGNGLTAHPERIITLYEKLGFVRGSTTLTKEIA